MADRILVPVDFSPMSKRALRAALSMAKRSPVEIHLLHVIPEYEVSSAFHIALPERAEIETQAGRWSEKAFETYLRGEDLGGTAPVQVVRYGNPARVICDYADEIGAEVILIASHGRSGFERAVFGSVAEKVLRTCRQPVMVVKGEV
ncbi:MAG: universal stress protein [Deferrisomatales bacterium]|nr:universal stress protein [Deferrisomatales bacterium]